MLRELFAKLGLKAKEIEVQPTGSPALHAATEVTAFDLIGDGAWKAGLDADPEAELALKRVLEREYDNGEAHRNLGRWYLAQGRAEDAADCFQLAIHFSSRPLLAYADLGAAMLALHRYEAAEDACRKALELDPASAVAWLRLGNALKARGDLVAAAVAYRAVLEQDADNPAVSCQLGFVLFKLGQYDESRQVFARLIERRSDFAEAHHNFGLLQLETGDAAEALGSFRRALAIKPETIETRACVAHSLRDLGRLDEAIAAYDAALARGPQFGDARINRCYALLMRGDYAAGWMEYEHRFPASEQPLRGFPFPQWRGEPLAQKRILVFAEQGLGDEIMFASCLPDLLAVAKDCVIECSKRLEKLFARSFPDALIHGANKDDNKAWIRHLPPVDFQIAVGSLPLHFRPTSESFPAHSGYLKADAQRVEYWKDALGASGKPGRIGIAWRGGILSTRQFLRSTRLLDWLPIIGQREFEFVSLQYGDASHELTELCARHHVAVRDLGAAVTDLDELAAVISALDLVISVDSTVVHLAGALGKRVWVLLPFAAEWRYLRQGDRMPWYPSARLFRQREPRDWTGLMNEVGSAVQTQFAPDPTA